MDHWDAIAEAIKNIENKKFTVRAIWLLHPKDFKKLHVNKVSIYFMKIIKRNRKLRNNGF